MFDFDPTWDEQDQSRNHNELQPGEEVLWRNAQWRVTNFYLEAKANPKLMGPPYFIEIAAIQFDLNLVNHVCTKAWVDRGLFLEAYHKARELHHLGINWNSKYEPVAALAERVGLTPAVLAAVQGDAE